MKSAKSRKSFARRTFLVLACAAALTVVACDNDVHFNPPTSPAFQNLTPTTSIRELEIAGTLTAVQGSAFEATILYDGEELAGARTVCQEDGGCGELELEVGARSAGGRHTISFQVLRQSPQVVDYLVEGTVRMRMTTGGLELVMTLPLERTRATLRTGDRVDFAIDFVD